MPSMGTSENIFLDKIAILATNNSLAFHKELSQMMLGFPRGSGSDGPGQIGSWLLVLFAGLCALAFVGGMYYLFELALEEIATSSSKPIKI